VRMTGGSQSSVKMPRLRALVVFGTRPEAIKLAPIIFELRRRPDVQAILCVTAQHREMLDQVLDIFELVPDADLDVMRADQRPEDVVSTVLTRVAAVIGEVRPDIVLVQGDTTTAMATALAAFLRQIPVGHVEAGLRTGVRASPFPEELMRRIVTQLANLHFAPTALAATNLIRDHANDEGSVFLTGNPGVDAVKWVAARRGDLPLPFERRAKRLVLLTAHRRENFGAPLESICAAARTIVQRHTDVEVAYPVHPNPNVQAVATRLLGGHERIHLLQPLSYRDLVHALQDATLVLTDSGGIQEEAPVFGKPVLVLRRDTERPEAIEAGTALLVGTDESAIVDATERLLTDQGAYLRMSKVRSPFGDGFAAPRIADILIAWRSDDLAKVEHLRWPSATGLAPYRPLASAT
jgi:UDP-N-acetylglucosamine 2-epimerase (non-hydrolysing)